MGSASVTSRLGNDFGNVTRLRKRDRSFTRLSSTLIARNLHRFYSSRVQRSLIAHSVTKGRLENGCRLPMDTITFPATYISLEVSSSTISLRRWYVHSTSQPSVSRTPNGTAIVSWQRNRKGIDQRRTTDRILPSIRYCHLFFGSQQRGRDSFLKWTMTGRRACSVT